MKTAGRLTRRGNVRAALLTVLRRVHRDRLGLSPRILRVLAPRVHNHSCSSVLPRSPSTGLTDPRASCCPSGDDTPAAERLKLPDTFLPNYHARASPANPSARRRWHPAPRNRRFLPPAGTFWPLTGERRTASRTAASGTADRGGGDLRRCPARSAIEEFADRPDGRSAAGAGDRAGERNVLRTHGHAILRVSAHLDAALRRECL